MGEKQLLRLAAIAESASEHPLGQAIVTKAKQDIMAVPNPDSFEAVSGYGLKAMYEGHIIFVGTRKLISENGILIPEKDETKLKELENMGKTAVLVTVDSQIAGIIRNNKSS